MSKLGQKKMSENVYYDETQRLPNLWYVISFSLSFLLLGYFVAGEFFLKNNWFYNSISNETRILVLLITIVITINILFSHLKITVARDDLRIHYWPLVNRRIRYDDIDKVEVIRYKPMIDFGTWGVRSFQDKDVTFNVNGTQGIRILLKNGHTLVIGSQMVSELVRAINRATEKKEDGNQFQLRGTFAI